MPELLRQIGEAVLRGVDALGSWIIDHRVVLTKITLWAAGIVAVPIIALYLLPSVLGLFASKLDPNLNLYATNRPVAFTFLDAAGDVVGRRGAVVGDRLTLDQMPPYLPAAFIAMEDRSFYSNQGIDPRGLARALIADLRAGRWVAGGSTITQQTAKIVFTQQERTMSRKLTELLDAATLQKSLSKKQILELYLNRIYLGSGAYGVDGAARVYFGKSARDVSLAEAAMLATLTRAPSVFSPRRDLARAQQRADVVLRAMVKTGAISEAEFEMAQAHPAVVVDRSRLDARNFFLDAARDDALRLAGAKADSTDLIIHTTLEPRIQDSARRAAISVIEGKDGRRDRASETAVVVMKPDGAVSAMIGGTDYDESTFNRAIQAHRQPGSAFKPFVYMAALEAGLTPWDVRNDEPVDINGWTPTNFGGRSYGAITLDGALTHSVNTVTANLAQEIGVDAVVEAAQRCGITSKLEANASLALGTSEVTPLELTGAYATFASGGYKVTPYLVTEVGTPGGKVLYRRPPAQPDRVIAEHVDRDLTAMLYDVVMEGTGRGASLWGREVAGKTGTTQDYHDAWFVGFTTDYVTGVWVGNDDSSPMRGVTGGSLPAKIWHEVMTAAERGMPYRPLDRSPPQAPTDETGLMASGQVPTMTDDEAALSLAEQQQQQQQQQEEKSRRGPVGDFFHWLFGSDEKKLQPGPDQQQQQPDDQSDGND